jgi:uncharacterized protein YqgC (DUF456 family)
VTPLLFTAGVLLIALGLVGLMLPAVPGAPLIFVGSLVVAWSEGFTKVGWFPLTLIFVLGVAGIALDYVATLFGARKAGASRWGMAGAVLGLIVGLPFGLPGIVVGPAIGAMALEYYKDPDMRRAGTAGAGVFIGFIVGTVLKYAFAFTMIGVLILGYLI